MHTETIELFPGDCRTYAIEGSIAALLLVPSGETVHIQAGSDGAFDVRRSAIWQSNGDPLPLGPGVFRVWRSSGESTSVTLSMLLREV